MVFFENGTPIGVFPQITMLNRPSDNSNTLIDNIFTNIIVVSCSGKASDSVI